MSDSVIVAIINMLGTIIVVVIQRSKKAVDNARLCTEDYGIVALRMSHHSGVVMTMVPVRVAPLAVR